MLSQNHKTFDHLRNTNEHLLERAFFYSIDSLCNTQISFNSSEDEKKKPLQILLGWERR